MDSKIKIAAYIYPKGLLTPTGVTMVTLNMVKQLAGNPKVELKLLASRDQLENGRSLPKGHPLADLPVIGLPFSRAIRESFWLGLNAPLIDRYVPKDFWIYCSTETYIPATSARRIVTVHHLEPPVKGPSFNLSGMRARTAAWRFRRAILSADLVVTQSHFTSRQVTEAYNISESKMVVIGGGVDKALIESTVDLSTLHSRANYGDYVISIGAFQLRKGTDYLFAMARELLRRGSLLKIVCPYGLRGSASFTEEVKSLPNIIALDYLDRNELIELIRGAVCMVIPSRLEGFGVTAIESMALGVPIVASNKSALPETVGDAGMLVNPEDTTSLTNAVERIFTDQSFRENLINLGRRRACSFTWSQCMDRLVASIANMQMKQ